jgi:hypothetical protein
MTIITADPNSIDIKYPDYKGMCDVLDRFIKIHELTGDKDILLHMAKTFTQPFVVIETEDQGFLGEENILMP